MVYKPLLAAFLAASVAVVDGRILSGREVTSELTTKEGNLEKLKHEAPGQLLKLERPPKEDRIDDDDDAYSDDTYSVSDDSTVVDEVLDSTPPVVDEGAGVSRKLLQIRDSIDKIDVIKVNEIAAEKIKLAMENKYEHPGGVEKDHHHPCHPSNGANGDHSCEDPHDHGDINQGDTAR